MAKPRRANLSGRAGPRHGRVGLAIAIAAVAGAGAAGRVFADSPRRWSITIPDGWADTTPAMEALATTATMRAKLAEHGGGTVETAAHAGPDDSNLQVIYIRQTRDPKEHGSRIANAEAGGRDGSKRLGTELSYHRADEANAIVIDQVIDGGVTSAYTRRIIGVDAAGLLHVLMATCGGPEAVCTPILLTVSLDRTGFLPLAQANAVQTPQDEGALGAMIGGIMSFVLLGALAGWWRFRERKRKRAAQLTGRTDALP